jgi:hypothetical protein
MNGLGKSKKEALVVFVPLSASGDSQDVTETRITTKQTQPKWKQRWIEINKIFQGNSKKPMMGDSTAYSNITWNQLKYVFNLVHYVQPQKEVNNVNLDFIAKFLCYTTNMCHLRMMILLLLLMT